MVSRAIAEPTEDSDDRGTSQGTGKLCFYGVASRLCRLSRSTVGVELDEPTGAYIAARGEVGECLA